MFGCLRGLLALPGPRLVVGHGLMLSVISWIRAHPGVALRQAFFPEAGYLSPMVLSDDQVRRLLEPLSDYQSRPSGPAA